LEDKPTADPREEPAAFTLGPGAQFALGFLVGLFFTGVISVLPVMLGLRAGTWYWVAVFALMWCVLFVALRFKWFALMVGMLLGIGGPFFVLGMLGFPVW
jgi:hypothetical protein